MFLRQVVGESMLPSLRPNMVVIAVKLKPRLGDIVIAKQSGREVIKRVSDITPNGYYLRGDNPSRSTDSRVHGEVLPQDLVGRVIIRLPSMRPFM